VTEEQIKALTFYQRSDLFDEKEKATIRYADSVTRGAAAMTGRSLEEMQKFFTEDEIVELTLVICVANFTNRFNDALQVVPDLG
jgi:alkylhydroperoxidase family enzyme